MTTAKDLLDEDPEDATWCLASPRHLGLFDRCPTCEIAQLRNALTTLREYLFVEDRQGDRYMANRIDVFLNELARPGTRTVNL